MVRSRFLYGFHDILEETEILFNMILSVSSSPFSWQNSDIRKRKERNVALLKNSVNLSSKRVMLCLCISGQKAVLCRSHFSSTKCIFFKYLIFQCFT